MLSLDGKRAGGLGRGRARRAGRDAGGDGAHPHHRLRLLLAQFRRALGARHRSSAARRERPRICRGSASGACARRRWCSPPARSSGRWSSTRTTGPASCSPARCAPTCTATACCRGSASSSSPTTIPAGTRRSTWRAPAARWRRSSISAPRWRRCISPRRRGAASPSTATRRSSATEGRHRISGVEVRPLARTAASASRSVKIDCDLLAVAGGWAPNVGALRAVARQAPLRRRRSRRSAPATPGSGSARPARRTAPSAWRNASPKARAPAPRRRGPPASTRRRRASRTMPRADRSGRGRSASSRSFRPTGRSTRCAPSIDLQDDVTTKDLAPRRAGRLPLGRARQALHDRRHGHRPGQGREPQRLRLPRLGARRERCRRSARRPTASPTSR